MRPARNYSIKFGRGSLAPCAFMRFIVKGACDEVKVMNLVFVNTLDLKDKLILLILVILLRFMFLRSRMFPNLILEGQD